MKKYIAFILAFVLCLALYGCGGDKPSDETTAPETEVKETESSEPDATETETNEEETALTDPYGHEYTATRVNYRDGFLGGLNADKMYISSVCHIPILKFETADQLEQFKNGYGEKYGLDHPHNRYDGSLSFNEATWEYDAEFFSENALLLVEVEATSGSLRYSVSEVYIKDQYCTVYIEQNEHTDPVTDDMAKWFITVAVSKEELKNATEFDAIKSGF